MNSFLCVLFSVIFFLALSSVTFSVSYQKKKKRERKKQRTETIRAKEIVGEKMLSAVIIMANFLLFIARRFMRDEDWPTPLAKATPSPRSLLLRPWGSLLCIVEFVHCSILYIHMYCLGIHTRSNIRRHIYTYMYGHTYTYIHTYTRVTCVYVHWTLSA